MARFSGEDLTMRSQVSKLVLSLMLVALLVPMMGSDGCDDDCGYSYDCGGGGFGFDFFDFGYSDDYYEEVYYEEGYYDEGFYDDGYYDDGYYDDGYYDDWKKKNGTRS
jgi:hypothetical protein